jgi:hypothetical protein
VSVPVEEGTKKLLALGFHKVVLVLEKEHNNSVWHARAMDPAPGSPLAELPESARNAFGGTAKQAVWNLAAKLGVEP